MFMAILSWLLPDVEFMRCMKSGACLGHSCADARRCVCNEPIPPRVTPSFSTPCGTDMGVKTRKKPFLTSYADSPIQSALSWNNNFREFLFCYGYHASTLGPLKTEDLSSY